MIDNDLCINLLKEEIEKKGWIQLKIHGDSMLPTMKDGDMITVELCDQYKIGDIVAYYTVVDNKVKIIVHRVVFVRKTYVLAKGDNNDFIDPLRVSLNTVIGRAEKSF